MPKTTAQPRKPAPPDKADGTASLSWGAGGSPAEMGAAPQGVRAARIVDFLSPPLFPILDKLLLDKTTGRTLRLDAAPDGFLSREWLQANPDAILPRVEKSRDVQKARTKESAEVFTPSGLCRRMIAVIDEDFAASGASWRRFVDSRRLEIACGEAPFVVQRYDAATGSQIPRAKRGGMLDAKLRAVDENAADDDEWWKWTLRAFESVYGYERAGDSLLIARANLVLAFADAVRDRFGREPTLPELHRVANAVVWNFWQMDGLTGETEAPPEPLELPGMPAEHFPDSAPPRAGLCGRGRPPGGPQMGEQAEFVFAADDHGGRADVATAPPPSRGELESAASFAGLKPALQGLAARLAAHCSRVPCRVFDWRARRPVKFGDIGGGVVVFAAKDARNFSRAERAERVEEGEGGSHFPRDRDTNLVKGAKKMKKFFDYAIGNPPYQEESIGNNASDTPVYHYFYDDAFRVADCVELISPARFLFNAGGTPKEWNAKMLKDPHLKILEYRQKSSDVFAGTSISGGIVVTLRNATRNYGAIETFSPFEELNSIVKKVEPKTVLSLSSIVSNRGSYRYSDLAYQQQPKEMERTADRRIAPSSFERMPELFHEVKPNDGNTYVKILGVVGGKRVYRWLRKDFLAPVKTLDKFKVFISKADGAAGQIGTPVPARICGRPCVEGRGVGSTETFISIGATDTRQEAEAIRKYVCTKFSRTMLGVLKVTQNCASPTWRYVPLQDFTSASDIDWSRSVKEIDRQLYKKYGLTRQEIDFIESHVKEME